MTTAVDRTSKQQHQRVAADVVDEWLARNPETIPPPISRWDVGRMDVFNEDRWQPIFRDMRAQAPINKVTGGVNGDYWNVSTYEAIQYVEAHPEIYSSSHLLGGISIVDPPAGMAHNVSLPMFIAMDRPDHTARRRTIVNAFTPAEMARRSAEIRERTERLLDTLPIGEQFDWVSRVSVELTTSMLAILFDFPREDSHLISYWSDWITTIAVGQVPEILAGRLNASQQMSEYFTRLWNERKNAKTPGSDLLSLMLNSDSLNAMSPQEFMGTMMLLVVGGNDTTRNTMSGLVLALDQFPEQRAKLEANPALAATTVAETIRYVSPVLHMRRTATVDTELFGHQIRQGDKVILWYGSANFDDSKFDQPEQYRVDRDNAGRHLAFGFGIHRCIGARLAEMQLRILIEEILARRLRVHVTGDLIRNGGPFMHALRKLEVSVERY